MPELPEVETVARGLREHGLVGVGIDAVRLHAPRTVLPLPPGRFVERVQGRRVVSVGRRAKYLVLRLEPEGTLLIHLRMTGRLRFDDAGSAAGPHERLRLVLSDGRALVFDDARRFGRFRWVSDADEALADLGPEPLDEAFSEAWLRGALRSRAARLKPLLLDQRFLAGLGNIYADEALWEARLHPLRRGSELRPAQVGRLRTAIRQVLRRGLDAQGTTLGAGRTNFYSVAGRRGENADNLRVFRRHGLPCPRCGETIRRLMVAQRSTHLCPRCQPAPGAVRARATPGVRRST